MTQIKLITINVEMNRHWDDIIPFLERESPDVLCLQEAFSRDIKMLEEKFGYTSIYLPTCKRWYGPSNTPPIEDQGIAVLSKLPLISKNKEYYYNGSPELLQYNDKSLETKRETIRQGIIWITVQKEGVEFTIANTHFTWTPNGMTNAYQEQDIKELFKILDYIPNLVICGDFNTPRNINSIYKIITNRFKDCVPADVVTTLDVNKHRVRVDNKEMTRIGTYVVDYIFSTTSYEIKGVRVEYGVSDHAAVIGTIQRSS
ncbi:MAG: endonuclease/exonuclease/phosphatase family protein [bacterium]|nr:endonuclease/exonuclease/phosphatase family protein [bacterium]